MTLAEQLIAEPDAELTFARDTLAATSAASNSTAVHERVLEDGSRVLITSVDGGEPAFSVLAPPDPEST